MNRGKLGLGLILVCAGCAGEDPAAVPLGQRSAALVTDAGGTLETIQITGAGGDTIPFALYLPPGYDTESREYAVVYHLHGIRGSYRDELMSRVVTTSHEAAVQAGLVEPMILVFPDGDVDPSTTTDLASFWADSFDGSSLIESDVMDAIMPHIDSNYRTVASRAGRFVQGFSMGGFGAAKFGTKFPNDFGALVTFDGVLFSFEAFIEKHLNDFNRTFGGNREHWEEHAPWRFIDQNAETLAQTSALRLVTANLAREHNELASSVLELEGITHDYVYVDEDHRLGLILNQIDPVTGQTVGEASWAFLQAVVDDASSVTTLPITSSATFDGWVGESAEESNVGGQRNSTANLLRVGDLPGDLQAKGILSFDTTLPPGATIVSATLSLKQVGQVGSVALLGQLRAQISRGAYGSTTLHASDFEAPAAAPATVVAVNLASGSAATTIPLPASALGSINPTGPTQMRLSFDTTDDDDGAADNIHIATAEHATAGFRPVLELTIQH